jgi:glyoxylase-like metal-dependent hydrolase (beta-lactamase superfamily II)
MSRLIFLAIATLACSVSAKTYPPVTVDMELTQVSPRVYYAQGKAGIATDNEGFISNSAAVVTDKGVVIIDALGSPSLAQRFVEKLREVTKQPVLMVIVTHYHADHIYGLQVYKDLGAEIIAPAGFREYLESPAAQDRLEERRVSLYPWVDEDTRLIWPDKIVAKDEMLRMGDVTLQITYLGAAHSDGDLSLIVQPDQVMISGDIIFEGRVPFTGSADTRHWLKVLEELNKNGVKALIPGHGPAASDPTGAVRNTLEYLRYTREQMAAAVAEMTPFDEAYADADWSAFSDLPAFEETHRRNAYGIYLSLEQEMMDR